MSATSESVPHGPCAVDDYGAVEVLDEQNGKSCALCGLPMDGWCSMTPWGYAHPLFLCGEAS